MFRLCAVIVVEGNADTDTEEYDDTGRHTDGALAYITAAWDEDIVYGTGVPGVVTVGDQVVYTAVVDGMATEYFNAPLKSDTQYTIFVRYDIENDADPNVVSTY